MRFPVPERPTSEMSTCLYTSQMCVSRSAFKFYIQKSCFRQRENSFLCMKYIKSLRRVMIMQKNSPVPNSRSMIRECTHTCQRNYFKNHDCKIHYLHLSNTSMHKTHAFSELLIHTAKEKRRITMHLVEIFFTETSQTPLYAASEYWGPAISWKFRSRAQRCLSLIIFPCSQCIESL